MALFSGLLYVAGGRGEAAPSPRDVDVHVVEDPAPANDGAAAFDVAELKKRGIEPFRSKSKEDMVNKVLGSLKAGDCIKNLYLYGHGAPGDISVGSGTKSVKSRYIDGNRPEWEPLLNKLKPKFCPGANLYLMGCNIGEGEKGAKKLQELADFLGVTVHGPVDAMTAGENADYLKNGRWQKAQPGKPAPAPAGTTTPMKPEKKKAEVKGVVIHTHTFETKHGTVTVNLPGDLAAGDRISGRVVVEPKGDTPETVEKNSATLSGYVVALEETGEEEREGERPGEREEGERTPVSSGTLTTTVSTAMTAISVLLLEPSGKLVSSQEIPVSEASAVPVPVQPDPGDYALPSIGQTGQPDKISGPFDGDFETTQITVNGEPAQILTESPRGVTFESPLEATGTTTLEVEERGVRVSGDYVNLALDLSIGRTTLKRGESETVEGKVSGLEGVPAEAFPLAYHLVNESPEVVSFTSTSGTVISGSIEREEVGPGGTFTFVEPIDAKQVGKFDIIASIGGPGWPPPPIPIDCLRMLAAIESWKSDDIELRTQASATAAELLAKEKERIHKQVIDELGELAFATFSLDIEPEGEVRTRELEDESCIYQALRNALTSDDAEVRARAQDVLGGGR